jgi:predicted ATPase
MQQGPRNLSDLGFGIGQLIPLLLTFANNLSSSKYRIYIIEEPETSLHPKFQSRLADLFTLYTANSNSNLIIETHSEYLIRKLQYLIAKGEYNSEDVVIYYLDLDDPNYEKRKNKSPQVREITIDRNGRMSQDFGSGFFDEADNIAIQLFNINQQSQN